jgi:DNA helicase-4
VPYSKQNAESTLISEVDRIVAKYGNSSILVLGRHSFDIHDFIQLNPLNRIKYFEQSGQLEIMGYSGLDIQYLTVHRSKGLEADNVILLNLSNQLKGFPNKMNHDPNLSLLLSDGEDYRFAEERRLFYVALTRTRNEATLLIPEDVSVFVEELAMDYNILMEEDSNVVRKTNCPYCVTGFLVVRNNPLDGNQFVGCSHYPSCNQTFQNLQILEKSILCPGCQSGFLVKRSGKFNSFLGCTNYPNCTKIIALEVV